MKEKPRGDLAGQVAPQSGGGAKSQPKGGLELPSDRPQRPAGPAGEPTPAPGASPSTPGSSAPAAGTGPAGQGPDGVVATPPVIGSVSAADYVFVEIAKVREIDSALVDHGAQSLLRMGEIGRAAAARALLTEHAPTLMTAAKTLLQSGVASDCELVQERLRTKLPNAACAPLVDTLCALDPVHGSPSFLAELLMHKQSNVRAAAHRHLAELGADVPLAALAAPLRAKDSDARLRAVQLVALSREPAALELLLDRMTDAHAVVARRVVDTLAVLEDERVELELMRRAFDGRWVLRDGAYALVTLCEREDRLLRPILVEAHAPRLLDGLRSSDPFIAGSCAAALAGIGFRAPRSETTAWLDREVPHRLIRAVSAVEFSADFSSLVPTATRRLALISGEDFGNDGPRWIEWWAARADTFRATRAALAVTVEEAGRLEISVMSNLDDAEAFVLLGPERADAAVGMRGEVSWLSASQARALFEVMRAAGLFGVERLPGTRGGTFDAGRTLGVTFDGQTKQFRFAGQAPEPWFTTALEAARAVRDRNRWQRFGDPSVYATPLDFWRAEAAWWDATSDERARSRRLWELVLARARHEAVGDRDRCVAELRRLAQTEGLITGNDFAQLAARLREERFLGSRARAWLGLAIAAGSRPTEDAGPVRLQEAFAGQLLSTLYETFDVEAASECARVMNAAGRDFARRCAGDERPFVRAVAAATLAVEPDERDLALLIAAVDDADDKVAAAALVALGENKVALARDAILERARAGAPIRRAAALRAAGMLGGPEVMTILLAAVSDRSDPALAPAATDGLAHLRDPGAVPVLLSILARGAEDACYASARRGLLQLGDAAWDELLRQVRSPSGRAKREAALILSEQLVPPVASVLMTMLSESPDDARIAEELAVLTCVDLRSDSNPSNAWWRWWEYVVHDDAQLWMVGALGRAGIAAPSPEELRAGTPAALEFLARVLARPEAYLAERARRELARLLGRDPGPLPERGPERDAWARALTEAVTARRAK